MGALLRRTNATLVSDKEPDITTVNDLVRGGGVIEAAELFELRAKLKEALKHNQKLLEEKKQVEDRQNDWIEEVEKTKTRNRELEFKMGGLDHEVIMADNAEIQKLKQEIKQTAFDYNNQINELQNMVTDQKLNMQVQMQEKDNKILELAEMLSNQKENVKPKAKRSNVNDDKSDKNKTDDAQRVKLLEQEIKILEEALQEKTPLKQKLRIDSPTEEQMTKPSDNNKNKNKNTINKPIITKPDKSKSKPDKNANSELETS